MRLLLIGSGSVQCTYDPRVRSKNEINRCTREHMGRLQGEVRDFLGTWVRPSRDNSGLRETHAFEGDCLTHCRPNLRHSVIKLKA